MHCILCNLSTDCWPRVLVQRTLKNCLFNPMHFSKYSFSFKLNKIKRSESMRVHIDLPLWNRFKKISQSIERPWVAKLICQLACYTPRSDYCFSSWFSFKNFVWWKLQTLKFRALFFSQIVSMKKQKWPPLLRWPLAAINFFLSKKKTKLFLQWASNKLWLNFHKAPLYGVNFTDSGLHNIFDSKRDHRTLEVHYDRQ